jgi:hypothetical protein
VGQGQTDQPAQRSGDPPLAEGSAVNLTEKEAQALSVWRKGMQAASVWLYKKEAQAEPAWLYGSIKNEIHKTWQFGPERIQDLHGLYGIR